MSRVAVRFALFMASCLLVTLTGCSFGPLAAPTSMQGSALHGSLHGGQQPISGARVYLFAAGTTGYGKPSVSLLSSSSTGLSDSLGAYVLTGNDGTFSISSDYSCVPGTQVYLYGLGGRPNGSGSAVNPSAGLLAILGECPTSQSFATTISYIAVNEVSTVAAAYAFAGFATDATHVSSSGTSAAQTGIANAFRSSANLVPLSTGIALAYTPASAGTVPQSEINTVANILASCVNSDPQSSTVCATLFANTLSVGATRVTPTDTATAAINIAHSPGTNVANLYGLATSTPPFAPALSGAPNDFTLAVQYSLLSYTSAAYFFAIDSTGSLWFANTGYRSSYGGYYISKWTTNGALAPGSPVQHFMISQPNGIAVDSSDNVWVVADNTVNKLLSNGSVAPGSPFRGGGLSAADLVAIDGTGNAWVTTSSPSQVSIFSNAGVATTGSPYTGNGLSYPTGLALDPAGNAWVVSGPGSSVEQLLPSGAAATGSPYSMGGSGYFPYAIAIDSASNKWVVIETNNSLIRLTATGATDTASPFTGGGLNMPTAIAIDGAGSAWVANFASNGVTQFAANGAAISPALGYLGGDRSKTWIAIDGSGNVWTTSYQYGTFTEFVGAAAPVVTPLALAISNNMLGTRP